MSKYRHEMSVPFEETAEENLAAREEGLVDLSQEPTAKSRPNWWRRLFKGLGRLKFKRGTNRSTRERAVDKDAIGISDAPLSFPVQESSAFGTELMATSDEGDTGSLYVNALVSASSEPTQAFSTSVGCDAPERDLLQGQQAAAKHSNSTDESLSGSGQQNSASAYPEGCAPLARSPAISNGVIDNNVNDTTTSSAVSKPQLDETATDEGRHTGSRGGASVSTQTTPANQREDNNVSAPAALANEVGDNSTNSPPAPERDLLKGQQAAARNSNSTDESLSGNGEKNSNVEDTTPSFAVQKLDGAAADARSHTESRGGTSVSTQTTPANQRKDDNESAPATLANEVEDNSANSPPAPERDLLQGQQAAAKSSNNTDESLSGNGRQNSASAYPDESAPIERNDDRDDNVEDAKTYPAVSKAQLDETATEPGMYTESRGGVFVSTQTTPGNQREDNNVSAPATLANEVEDNPANSSPLERDIKNVPEVQAVQVSSDDDIVNIPDTPSSPNISEILRELPSDGEHDRNASSSVVSNEEVVAVLASPDPNVTENVATSLTAVGSDSHASAGTFSAAGAVSAETDTFSGNGDNQAKIPLSSTPVPDVSGNSSVENDVARRQKASHRCPATSHRKSSTAPSISSADVERLMNVQAGIKTGNATSAPVLTSFGLGSSNHTMSMRSLSSRYATEDNQASAAREETIPSERNDSFFKPEDLKAHPGAWQQSAPPRSMTEPKITGRSLRSTFSSTNSHDMSSRAMPNPQGTSVPNNPQSDASASGSAEKETAEILLPHLRKEVLNPDYHPVEADVREFIHRECKDRVEFGAFHQSPFNSKDIEIVGGNVEFLRDIIFPTMPQFPGYTFKITESTNPMHVQLFGGDPFFKVQQNFVVEGGYLGRAQYGEQTSKCGLILEAPNQDINQTTECYAMFPAHVVIKEFCESLFCGETIQEVRDEVTLNADNVRYQLTSCFFDSSKPNDLVHLRPMFCFRWFKSLGSFEFMNDSALLPIKHWQIHGEEERQPGVKRSQLKSAMTKLTDCLVTRREIEEETAPIKNVIYPLESVDTLIEMGKQGVELIVGDRVGYMVPCGEEIRYQAKPWAHAIEFVLRHGEFQNGDCGLIAYVKDSRDGTLYPFGMFNGKSDRTHTCGARIYKAIVLSEAIRELEADYPKLVYKLKPMPWADNRGSTDENLHSRLCGDPARSSTISNECGTGARPKEYYGRNANRSSRRDESGYGESVPDVRSSSSRSTR